MSKGLPRSLSRGQGANTPKVTKIPFSKTISVAAVSTAVGFGSAVIGDFPKGMILLLGAVIEDLVVTGDGTDIDATFDGDFGIGTTPAADATISGADVDIIGSTALATAVDDVSTQAAAASNVTPALFDNSDGSLEINLNLLVDAADIADDSTPDATATGTLRLAYAVL